jgi:hypothetical protein
MKDTTKEREPIHRRILMRFSVEQQAKIADKIKSYWQR